jgi:erythromycin esterase
MVVSVIPGQVLNDIESYRWNTAGLKPLETVLDGIQIVGVGESAHFTREFNEIRSVLIQYLAEEHGFTTIALECSSLQASHLNEWLYREDDVMLKDIAGPLTCALYGTVLKWLKLYMSSNKNVSGAQITISGVDLPNTLSPIEELEQVAAAVRQLDPPFAQTLGELLQLLSPVRGESAVMSSSAWSELGTTKQDRAFSIMTRLRHRLTALAPVKSNEQSEDSLMKVLAQINCVEHTLESLRAMTNLFEGSALDGETSVRDAFIAQSLIELSENDPERRIIFLAHNNHIQKTAVSFEGELSGVPAGQHLAGRLKNEYRAIALTHLGGTVPEMDFPSPKSAVGFDVIEMPADALHSDSIEEQIRLVHPDDTTLAILGGQSNEGQSSKAGRIRSQSASAVTDIGRAFDAVICTPGATRDQSISF